MLTWPWYREALQGSGDLRELFLSLRTHGGKIIAAKTQDHMYSSDISKEVTVWAAWFCEDRLSLPTRSVTIGKFPLGPEDRFHLRECPVRG